MISLTKNVKLLLNSSSHDMIYMCNNNRRGLGSEEEEDEEVDEDKEEDKVEDEGEVEDEEELQEGQE